MTGTRTRSGRYAGKTADERRAERRARLVAAGKEIWTRDGWAAVSMRAVCAEAGLIDRYFYESFANADDLRCSIWDELRGDVIGAMHDDFVSRAGEPGVLRLRSSIEAVAGRPARRWAGLASNGCSVHRGPSARGGGSCGRRLSRAR